MQAGEMRAGGSGNGRMPILFFRNEPNRALDSRGLEISPEYSWAGRGALFVLWLVLLPICIPLWLLLRAALGALMLSGMIAFWIVERAARGIADPKPEFRWQCVRAFINNTVASRIPHWNAPFRRFLYRLSGVRIGRGGFIGMHGYMEDYQPQNVAIEDGVTVSFGVTFIAHGIKHGMSEHEKTIILRKGCSIGAGSILLPGIEIGSSAVVGAGSVVTKSVPPGAIVAGAPARILKYRPGFEPAPGQMPQSAARPAADR